MRGIDVKRIMEEARRAKSDNDADIYIMVNPEDIHKWNAVISGPPDTPFAGFFFKVRIHLPETYPIAPPSAFFETPVFHPNVSVKGAQAGEVCLDILKKGWTPAWGVYTLCMALRLLLSEPAPESPFNTLAANLVRLGDKIGYASMVGLFCNKFALRENPMVAKND